MSFVPLNMALEFDGQVHDPSSTNGPLVAADSTPTWAVFEQGNPTAIYTGNMTARATTGVYFMAGTASAVNGFNVGKLYQVKMTAVVGGVTDITVLARFILVPAWLVTGVPLVDVADWKGATAPAMTGDAFARLGPPAGASASADIAAINAKTTNLPASPAAVGSAMTLSVGERTAVADAFLDRDMSLGSDTGSTTVRTPRQALRFLRNKWNIALGTLNVKKEDDATTSWTAAVTTTAGDPVSQIDPA